MLPRIAVDVMGSDFGPKTVIEGCCLAAESGVAEILLVGDSKTIAPHLEKIGKTIDAFQIVDASQSVGNDEAPASAVRKKANASVNLACGLLTTGRADAFISAGHTGAALSSAVLHLGCMPGVGRPALIAKMPCKHGRDAVLLDVGATIRATPRQLFEFAHLGAAFARLALGNSNPSIALISNGTERNKGRKEVRLADELLDASPLNYIGPAEGQDIFSGEVDVLVCDGFVGNVLLKAVEGVVEVSLDLIETQGVQAPSDAKSRRDISEHLHEQLHFSRRGGAFLAGVNGLVVVAHGRSNATALFNSIRLAADYSKAGIVDRMTSELSAALS